MIIAAAIFSPDAIVCVAVKVVPSSAAVKVSVGSVTPTEPVPVTSRTAVNVDPFVTFISAVAVIKTVSPVI